MKMMMDSYQEKKVEHMVPEKYHSLYNQCCNLPLDKFQKQLMKDLLFDKM